MWISALGVTRAIPFTNTDTRLTGTQIACNKWFSSICGSTYLNILGIKSYQTAKLTIWYVHAPFVGIYKNVKRIPVLLSLGSSTANNLIIQCNTKPGPQSKIHPKA